MTRLQLETIIATELAITLGYQKKQFTGKQFWAEVERLAEFGEDWEEQEILL